MLSPKTRTFLWNVLLVAIAVLMASAAVVAQEQTVTFDPDKTTVSFTLGDVLHTVHGTFRLRSGVIRFDQATGAASGALVVDATSGDSGNKSRDKKMNRDVLESDKYPEIVFVPQKVSGRLPAHGNSQVTVDGIFRMHGSEHPLSLTVPLAVDADQIQATTQFLVPYQAWGLKNPSTLFLRVSNKVEMEIVATGRLAQEQARLPR